MTVLSTRWCALPILVALATGSCDSSVGHVHGNWDPACEATFAGATHFVGEEKCFKAFPPKRISGYMVLGMEYSVFHRDRHDVQPGYDPNAAWLQISEEAELQVKELPRGRTQLLKVSFDGRDPGRDGAYGNGTFKRGIFVDKFLNIEDIGTP